MLTIIFVVALIWGAWKMLAWSIRQSGVLQRFFVPCFYFQYLYLNLCALDWFI